MADTSDRLKSHAAAQPVIAEIMALLSQVVDRFEPEHSETRQWMAQHCSNPAIAEMLPESTLLMPRVLDAIGQLEPVNGITISKQFGIPKGSVSKATRRLIAKSLLQQESLPNNRKKSCFASLRWAESFFTVHQAFDQQMERGFTRFLQRYDADALGVIVGVLQDSLEVSFLELGSHPESAESGREPS